MLVSCPAAVDAGGGCEGDACLGAGVLLDGDDDIAVWTVDVAPYAVEVDLDGELLVRAELVYVVVGPGVVEAVDKLRVDQV